MYHRGYTCGFFPSRKSNINSTSTFSLRVGFCRPSLRKILISETAPLIADVGVQAGESDFRAQLLKLRSQKVEAIIVFVWDQRSLLSLLQQITTSIPNIPLATIHDGSGWVEDPAFKPFLPRLTYTRFVLKDPAFEPKFKARFGYTPILTASNAYDALNSVLSAFAAGHDTGEKCRNYLMNNQLDSVTFGSFRFNQDGSVPSIVEVVDYVSGR